MATYGYARVSSVDQNEARQIDALQKAGCEKIYLDKQSGKDFERPEYQKMLRKLKADDTVIVQALDRFGRDYELIKEQWELITKRKNANIVVLDMPILDTRIGQGLVGKFLADVVVQLLAFVSQTERENIRKRQAEGIRLAKERGVKFGHEPKPLPADWEDIYNGWANKELTVSECARRCGVARATFRRNARLYTEGKLKAKIAGAANE